MQLESSQAKTSRAVRSSRLDNLGFELYRNWDCIHLEQQTKLKPFSSSCARKIVLLFSS